MKINSITDVITNSSSEVFIINLSDPLYQEIKKETEFLEFLDFDSLRDFILSDSYYCWNAMFSGSEIEIGNPDYNPPSYDVFESYSDIEKTSENWEKYKDLYKGLLGIAVANLDRDSDECRRIHDILYRDHFKKNLSPVVEKFEPGKRYYGTLKTDDQEISFMWNGEEVVTVEGSKFNPFQVNITTLLDLIKLDTIHEN